MNDTTMENNAKWKSFVIHDDDTGKTLFVIFSLFVSVFVNANLFSDSSIFEVNRSENSVLNILSFLLNPIVSRAYCRFWSSFVEILPYVDWLSNCDY